MRPVRLGALLALAALGCQGPLPAGQPAAGGESSELVASAGSTAAASAPAQGVLASKPASGAPASKAQTADLSSSIAPAAEPRPPNALELARYPWLTADRRVRPLSSVVAPPPSYRRVTLEEGSFGAWLRDLPLRPEGASVHAYDGRELLRPGDSRVAAVAEIDVSPVDLQQCADSVIRLHAEWQYASGRAREVGYHFLSGDYATFARYAAGERPQVDGPRVRWATVAHPNEGRESFRAYLDMVFNYASTISLAQRQARIAREEAAPGDFIVLPGGPGHAIAILDIAEDEQGRRVALLGQGFMPAQDFHVLASREATSPWFSLEDEAIDTPFWPEPFPWSSLRRFQTAP